MLTDILAVNEIYGPTFQGEGLNLGTPCMFLRLAGCNLACSWCDTKYAWDWKNYDSRQELHPMTLERVIANLEAAPVRHLVITGGEPMLQQANIIRLLKVLDNDGWTAEIETAGTIAPAPFHLWHTRFNVSPKLSNSGNPERKRKKLDALRQFVKERASFKFVVQNERDLKEVDQLVEEIGVGVGRVYIMPEGTTKETIDTTLQQLADAVIARRYNLTTRLHVQLYGKKRGV